MKLLLVGATGLVGSHVLKLALANEKVSRVVVLTRSPISIPRQAKLQIVNVDFDALPNPAEWWQADAVICTLGTTIKKAKSKETFKKVDHDYPLAIAKMARKQGSRCYVLNSAMGAKPDSLFFYSRVKGDLEQHLSQLDYPSLTFVRPGLISGDRKEKRTGEQLMLRIMSILNPVLPKKLRLNPAENIAAELLKAALNQQQGVEIISSERLA